MKIKNLKLTIFFITLLCIFSCSKKEKDPSAEKNYIKAYNLLKDQEYSEAAKEFEKIEDDFPFSKWAPKGQIMAAFSYYKNKDYADVIRVVDDFIRINPADDSIPYMTYLKAMCYYNQIPHIDRAQDNTKLASVTFRELIARFPDTDHAVDAKEKLVFVDQHLAGAKMSVGRYQIKQENYLGALQNFQDVVSRYHYTDQAAEGYFRLTEIYQKLGLRNEAQKANNLLQENYPTSYWAKAAQDINSDEDKKFAKQN